MNFIISIGNFLITPMNANRKCVCLAKYLAVAQLIHVVALIAFTATPMPTIGLFALNAVAFGLLHRTRMPTFAILPVAIGFMSFASLLEYNFSLIPIIEF